MWPTIVVTERPTIGHINPLDLDALHGAVTDLILISFDDKDLMFCYSSPAEGNIHGTNICSLNHQIGREINNKIKKFYSLNLLKSISSLYPVFKLSKSKLIFHLRAATDGNNYFLLSQLRAAR